MKALPSLLRFAFVLSFVPSLAWGDEPSPVEWARARITAGLVTPLANLEGRRFARSRPAPRERRVRVLSSAATPDQSGRPFLAFAIDVKFGSEWHANDVVGCVYPATGDLFVKKGNEYRPAEFLLGKNVPPVTGVCDTPKPRS